MLISALLVVCAVGIAFLLLSLFRNEAVYRFRIKLLREESEWAGRNLEIWGRYHSYRREDSLPSYGRMLLEFWKPLRRYENSLKPIEHYYQGE